MERNRQKPLSIAKITRPKLSVLLERKRLFKLLDSAGKKPIIWLSAPAGSGKTTLVASYLDRRGGACPRPKRATRRIAPPKSTAIWYSVDAGDTDIASFFYYMGIAAKKAAPRYKKTLPLLTPEYLAGIPTFTRRWFENLFGRLSGLNCLTGGSPKTGRFTESPLHCTSKPMAGLRAWY
jgi:hypothetical protein